MIILGHNSEDGYLAFTLDFLHWKVFYYCFHGNCKIVPLERLAEAAQENF